MITIVNDGIDVGVEIDDSPEAADDRGAANVRYFITRKDETKVYIPAETAAILCARDQAFWLRQLDLTLDGLRDAYNDERTR